MKDRIDHLKALTGLPVSTYTVVARPRAVNYFVFGHEYNPIKTVCTYCKALTFAEGFALGRTYERATS